MFKSKRSSFSRRGFCQLATAAPGLFFTCCGRSRVAEPMTRPLGRTGYEVTSLGLGGQASLQWTPRGVDPEQIILKAFDLGVTYFDTSNVYGPSQINYGKAFRRLHLIPGQPGYDEAKRRSIVVATKTQLRHAKGSLSSREVDGRTEGPDGSGAVEDLKRSLSQLFGDGRGNYPEGAYVDIFQIHNLRTIEQLEAVYLGLTDPDPAAERIGALAALRDYRDGTNRTGLNPKEERLIRHIGFSGHFSSPVNIEFMQRDEENLIDTMLVAINANDRQYLNHQFNDVPVAAAKNMGIIAMKVFADGAMYTKAADWTRTPDDLVMTVGNADLPSRPLIRYTLSTPGVSTLIIGTGQVSVSDQECQLTQNMAAAQVRAGDLSQSDREEVERSAGQAKAGKTNWFQEPDQPLSAPREPELTQQRRGDQPVVRLAWHTAYAGRDPVHRYEVWRDQEKVGEVEHKPQVSKDPFSFEDILPDGAVHSYKIVTVDAAGRTAATEELRNAAMS